MISRLATKADSVRNGCDLLDVSRSGYYAYRKPRSDKEFELRVKVRATFIDSGKSYGSRRMAHALRAQGKKIGRFRVRRIMREEGLQVVWRRRYRVTTDSNHHLPVAENLLNRKFAVAAPSIAWVSDITYIRTHAGWAYLAAVLDLYSRKVIGWAIATSLQTTLIVNALNMAINRCRPSPGVLLHSDRGSQYASDEYQTLLDEHGMICSMSRRANCWDNAVMERFFLNLKTERVWQKQYANCQEAKYDIVDYIENFYNSRRLHSAIGYQAPADYEKEFYRQQKNRLLVSEIS